jgi:hypothetical protein
VLIGYPVCAIERLINPIEKTDTISRVIPVAGDLRDYKGGLLDASLTRLRTSPSPADQEREGLRIELNGGLYQQRKQKAVVELICDPNRTGLEGDFDPEDKYSKEKPKEKKNSAKRRREGGKDETEVPKGNGTCSDSSCMPALQFKKYGPDPTNADVDVLHLQWSTKWACESLDGEAPPTQGHWGFFTWFILLYVSPLLPYLFFLLPTPNFPHFPSVPSPGFLSPRRPLFPVPKTLLLTPSPSAFLITAAYLIFGSWLNYNRYGARGWDALPHNDTIRDLPYLLKDWTKRVFSTIQGGSRGGYSAV